MQTVGQLVRQRRAALGLTVTALAAAVGASKGYLSMLENQRLANPPSPRVLAGLERALGIAGGELLRVAQWQNTPAPVQAEVGELAAQARAGHELARWLKRSAPRRKDGARGLDELFRSGELARRVHAALQAGTPAEGPGAPRAGKSGRGPTRRGAGGAPPSGGPGGGPAGGATRGIERLLAVQYQVPLINRVAAGYPRDFTDLAYPARVADEYVGCPDLADADAFAARVVGDSMLPAYREGDVVVFSPAAAVTDGSDCFVRLEPDHESTFKRVFFEGQAGRKLRLQPLNPQFPAQVVERRHVAGLYKAVWRMQRV